MSDLSSVLTAETCQAHSILYRVKLNCVPNDFVRRRFVLVIFVIRAEMAYTLPIRTRACLRLLSGEELARARAFTQAYTRFSAINLTNLISPTPQRSDAQQSPLVHVVHSTRL